MVEFGIKKIKNASYVNGYTLIAKLVTNMVV